MVRRSGDTSRAIQRPALAQRFAGLSGDVLASAGRDQRALDVHPQTRGGALGDGPRGHVSRRRIHACRERRQLAPQERHAPQRLQQQALVRSHHNRAGGALPHHDTNAPAKASQEPPEPYVGARRGQLDGPDVRGGERRLRRGRLSLVGGLGEAHQVQDRRGPQLHLSASTRVFPWGRRTNNDHSSGLRGV